MPSLRDLLLSQQANAFNSGFKEQSDRQTAATLADTNKDAAQAKALADLFKLKQEGSQDLQKVAAVGDQTRQSEVAKLQAEHDMLNQVKHEAPAGSSYSAGGLHVGVDPFAAQAKTNERFATQERARASKEYGGLYKGAIDQAGTIQFMHELLNTPPDQQNAYIDKYMSINKARLGEGASQRLLQSVIKTFGGDPTLYGDYQTAKNYLTSKANSTVSPQSRLQLLDSVEPSIKHVGDELDTADSTIRNKHAVQYPHLGGPDDWVKAEGSTARDNYTKLMSTQKGLRDRLSKEAAAASPTGMIKSGVKSLAGMFGVGKPAAPKDNYDNMTDEQLEALVAQKKGR